MNKKIDDAIFGVEKLNALADTFDRLYLDYTVPPDEQDRLNRGAYVFQAIRDEIDIIKSELADIVTEEE